MLFPGNVLFVRLGLSTRPKPADVRSSRRDPLGKRPDITQISFILGKYLFPDDVEVQQSFWYILAENIE